MTADRCDYLIIGAGASGCVLAARLSENLDHRVTLIEYGAGKVHPMLSVPGLAGLAMGLRDCKVDFATEPVPGMNNRPLRWTQGRVVGGGSSINGLVYMRGHSSQYDAWDGMGCTGWSFADVLPYYKRAETHALGESPLHGGSGPIIVKPSRSRLPISEAFIAALSHSGLPRLDDLNGDAVEGVGYHDINAGGGRRISTAVGYLSPALRRRNLTLLPKTRALRVLVESGRATGVEVEHGGIRRTIRAEREVILSCGAIQSPQLLLLSGIGPAEQLRAHGLRVEVDSPEVGRNLINHPNYQLQYACAEPVSAYRYMNPLRAFGCGLAYLARRGPLAECFFAAGGFFRTEPQLSSSDIYVVTAPALLRHGGLQLRMRDLLPAEHGFMASVSLGRPQSRGQIQLRSADPGDPPMLLPNYYSEPDDLFRLARGVRMLRDMLRDHAFGRYVSADVQPGPDVVTEAQIRDAIRARGGTGYHPMGTCRMGGDAASVVDPGLRLRGVDNLRVADASIMPTALTATTHAQAIMIGEKAAALIRGD